MSAPQPDLSTPDAAEAAFYNALATADFPAMAAVWDEAPGAVCVHPGWPPLHGRESVLASFRHMFEAGQRLELRHETLLRRELGGHTLHLTHEYIAVAGATVRHPPMVASNLYRRTATGWRLVLHHASPTPTPPASGAAVH